MEYIYDNKIKLTFPDEFKEMNSSDISEFFTDDKNIKKAFLNKLNNSNIVFSENKYKLNKDNIQNRIIDYYKLYSRIVPGFEPGEQLVKIEDDLIIGVITFKCNSLTKDLFNIMAIIGNNDSEIIVLLSCVLNDVIKIFPIYKNIIDSIKLCE